MAFLTGDWDIKRNWFFTHQGGNGDFYLSIQRENPDGTFEPQQSVRIVMSGSKVPQEVRHAAVALHRAMEKYGLNKAPQDSDVLF